MLTYFLINGLAALDPSNPLWSYARLDAGNLLQIVEKGTVVCHGLVVGEGVVATASACASADSIAFRATDGKTRTSPCYAFENAFEKSDTSSYVNLRLPYAQGLPSPGPRYVSADKTLRPALVFLTPDDPLEMEILAPQECQAIAGGNTVCAKLKGYRGASFKGLKQGTPLIAKNTIAGTKAVYGVYTKHTQHASNYIYMFANATYIYKQIANN